MGQMNAKGSDLSARAGGGGGGGVDEDDNLFNPLLLKSLEYNDSYEKLLQENSTLEVRPLRRSDFETGFLQLLGELTIVGLVDGPSFDRRFAEMKKSGCYYIIVVEDKDTGRVVGCSTLAIEFKFIHELGLRARLEDVVVGQEYRGKRLGKLLVETVRLLAQRVGCYKLSLDCKDEVIPFYSGLGFVAEPGRANMLVIRFKG